MEFASRKVVDVVHVVHVGVGDTIDKWSPFYRGGQDRACFPASASDENAWIRSILHQSRAPYDRDHNGSEENLCHGVREARGSELCSTLQDVLSERIQF